MTFGDSESYYILRWLVTSSLRCVTGRRCADLIEIHIGNARLCDMGRPCKIMHYGVG